MTDKDKMIEEMVKSLEGIDLWGSISLKDKVKIATHLFNAGIRPKEGFELDMSETKQELFEEDISIKPKQYEEE